VQRVAGLGDDDGVADRRRPDPWQHAAPRARDVLGKIDLGPRHPVDALEPDLHPRAEPGYVSSCSILV
jgi:hypothetical protein